MVHSTAREPAQLDDLRVVIVDYGVGNLRNVFRALRAVGAPAEVVQNPERLADAAGIVLPGVGAFADAAANLRAAGFEEPLRRAVADGVPLLGICVGMQLLFDESDEMGRHAGLGVIPGVVRRLPEGRRDAGGLVKVPHIGWTELSHDGADPLLAGVVDGAHAYFVHSYFCAPSDPVHVLATCEHGVRFAAVVRRGTTWGVQWHPEKSQAVGLKVMLNFANTVRRLVLAGGRPGARPEEPS